MKGELEQEEGLEAVGDGNGRQSQEKARKEGDLEVVVQATV